MQRLMLLAGGSILVAWSLFMGVSGWDELWSLDGSPWIYGFACIGVPLIIGVVAVALGMDEFRTDHARV